LTKNKDLRETEVTSQQHLTTVYAKHTTTTVGPKLLWHYSL